jgi:uncharacterized protein
VKIDISKLEHEPLRFDDQFQLEREQLSPDQVVGPITVHLRGEVRPSGDFYSITGVCSAEGPLPCSRCLEPVPWKIEEEFSFECRQSASAPLDAETVLEDRDLDVAFVQGEELDLTELAAEQVLLAMPMRILCNTDCAGLCASCGANLNTVDDCGCTPEVDPRWQALADLAGSSRES